MTKDNIKNIVLSFRLMERHEKVYVSYLFVILTINSLIQTVGLVSIMPFIALISDPSLVESNRYILWIKSWLGIEGYSSLLFFFAILTFMSLLISNFFVVLNYWLSLRFFNNRGHKLSTELLGVYLQKTPINFNRYSIASLSKTIYSDVDRVLVGTQMAAISLISDFVVSVVIFFLLLYVDIWVTIFTSAALGLTYFVTYLFIAKKINTLGEQFSIQESEVFSTLTQALSLFREIRVSGKSDYFVNRFDAPTKALSENATRYYSLSFIPMQVIELIAFAAILLTSSYIALSDSHSNNAIVTITVFAFASYRLIPILKSIFDSIEEIIYGGVVLGHLLGQFTNTEADPSQVHAEVLDLQRKDHKNSLHFEDKVRFKDVCFQYKKSNKLALNTINIDIVKNKMTCIYGRSGAGKSTLLDLLLGLLSPASGNILIDDVVLCVDNIRAWQNKIGYVPQKIQLLDGSVAENIAFGEASDQIDLERVKEVASLACIAQHIENMSQDAYQCRLGDGGTPLSGGERQRIGIARSLYHRPELLVFDEATNELDQQTELHVINNIRKLPNLTLLFVSHKPDVIAMADDTIELVATHYE